MFAARVILLAGVLALWPLGSAQADDLTPLPDQATPVPVATQPAPPPSSDVPPTEAPVVASPSTAPDTNPAPVQQEHNGTVKIDQPPASVPTQAAVGPEVQPAAPLPVQAVRGAHRAPLPGHPYAGPSVPSEAPPQTLPPVTVPDVTTIIDPSAQASASAPAQLSCHGKARGPAGPFMVAPYSGWTEITSFLDHDFPDYAVDGKIVLANGMTATSGDGTSSDFFPAYWAPVLRQYVNYDGHNGYDFDISYQPVLAAAAGTVRFAGWNEQDPYAGYGQMVLIDHHNGYVTLYAHLSKLEVEKGDRVSAGQEIGISGTTGHSSGPHLHFSVFHNCRVTDPYGWTGRGRDPLRDFNGERSGYLWLPGRDPLVLNPPPTWPAYPTGLPLGLPPLPQLRAQAAPGLPPVDRLVLLALPRADKRHAVPLAVALARTEAAVEREAQSLSPYLDDLRTQNLLQSYQIIPAAAAIWIRASATAAQLEGLPHVASLTGVRPRDLQAAQSGLAHSVLIQSQRPQTPSLWPVGFRSGVDGSRPVITVVDGQALVAGFTGPGRGVAITLHRGSGAPGLAAAAGDAETGGFVTTIHDAVGNPLPVRAGDRIRVLSAGRSTEARVTGLTVKARSYSLTGTAGPAAAVPIVLTSSSGRETWSGEVAPELNGPFHVRTSHSLAMGTLATATLLDSAGNQESAAGFVPGVEVSEHGSQVQGWAAGHSPTIWVYRRGRLLVAETVRPGADGNFSVQLTRRGHPFVLIPGDLVRVGSRWHQHTFTLPELGLQLESGDRRITVQAPAGRRLSLSLDSAHGASSSGHMRLTRTPLTVVWPGGPLVPGDIATLQLADGDGDVVQFSAAVRELVVHEGDSLLTGRVRPGTTVSVHVETSSHRQLGSAVAASDAESGRFVALVRDSNGYPLTIQPGMRVWVLGVGGRTALVVPPLRLAVVRAAGGVLAWTSPGTVCAVTGYIGARAGRSRRLTADRSGRLTAPFGTVELSRLSQVNILSPQGSGWSVERSLALSGGRVRAQSVRGRTSAGKAQHKS